MSDAYNRNLWRILTHKTLDKKGMRSVVGQANLHLRECKVCRMARYEEKQFCPYFREMIDYWTLIADLEEGSPRRT